MIRRDWGARERSARGIEDGKLMTNRLERRKKDRVVRTNCKVPSPKILFFILFNLSFSNSSPISKRKKTMPRSARYSVRWGPEGERRLGINGTGDEGERRKPTIREQRIWGIFRVLDNGGRRAVRDRRRRGSVDVEAIVFNLRSREWKAEVDCGRM